MKITEELLNDSYLTDAYRASCNLLKQLSTEDGFIASAENKANYKRIWSRDGVIAGLASLLTDDEELINSFKLTLNTLKRFQDHTGRIASNIDVATNEVSFGTTVGRIDATLWYVIGVCQYRLKTSDEVFWSEFKPSVDRALFYLECLELNGRGLIHIPPGGDWADEYINHGYVLFDQMLYFIANQLYGQIDNDEEKLKKSQYLANLIRVNYFPKSENLDNPFVYHQAIFKQALKEYQPPIPVTYFTSHSVRYHLDNFANSLLLLADLLDPADEKMIADVLNNLISDSNQPILPAFHPVITEGDPFWPRLLNNYLYQFKNEPYHFHNGGRWPLVHGFFLSALDKEGLKGLLDLAKVLKRDNFIFPEYYIGNTGKPAGTLGLSFSASGFIIAYQAVLNKRLPFSLKI